MKRMFAASAMVMAVSMGARAETFEDGDSPYQKCSARIEQIQYSFCVAYVSGVSDVLSEGDSVDGCSACFPPNFKVGQAKDAVEQFLASHPQWRHHAATGLVAEALSEAFPCR